LSLVTQIVNSNNVTQSFTALQGTTSSIIQLTTKIIQDYTLFHICRYTGVSNNRIIQGGGINWLSGFWANNTSCAYHGKWLTAQNNLDNNNWILSTDNAYNYRSNCVSKTLYSDGTSYLPIIYINGGQYPNEASTFQIVDIIIFASKLSLEQILSVEIYLAILYGITPILQSQKSLVLTFQNTMLNTAPMCVTFLSDGILTLTSKTTVNYFIAAGGGSGGMSFPRGGGGGGAGGYLLGSITLDPGTYPVVVGKGGIIDINDMNQGVTNNSAMGGNSSFNGFVAYGGANGCSSELTNNNGKGGSGGGGSSGTGLLDTDKISNGVDGIKGQGFNGGNGFCRYYSIKKEMINNGGGGGGATQPGNSGESVGYGGNGGDGILIDSSSLPYYTSSNYFCGGGGGGSTSLIDINKSDSNGGGGKGGGGSGFANNTKGGNGIPNTGGGGGGGMMNMYSSYRNFQKKIFTSADYIGFIGGSGIVILTYLTSQNMASQNAASQNAASQNAASQNAASQNAASQNMASQNMASQNAASQNTASQHMASQHMTSQNMASQNAASLNAASQDITPQNIIPRNIIPQNIVSQNAESQNIDSKNTSSKNIDSKNIILIVSIVIIILIFLISTILIILRNRR
jgi:hypothetical protein